MTEHFQIAVIGSDIAGLLAAVKLQLAGNRVLLAPDNNDQPGEVLHGYWCPDGSAYVPVPAGTDFNQVLVGLGLKKAEAADEICQLLLPECRIDLLADMTANESELTRAFSGDSAAIAVRYATLKEPVAAMRQLFFGGEKTLFPDGVVDKFKRGLGKSALKKVPLLPAAGALPASWLAFEQLWLAVNSHCLAPAAALSREAAFPLSSFWQKSYRLPAESGSLAQLLQKHFVELGGQLQAGPVTAINVKSGKLSSLVIEKAGEFTFDTAILAGRQGQAALVSRPGAAKKMSAKEKADESGCGIFTAHFLFNSQVRPMGMADRGCCLTGEEAVLQVPALLWELSTPCRVAKNGFGTQGSADESMLLCTVKVAVSAEQTSTATGREGLLAVILHYLKEIIPFSGDFLIDSTASTSEGRFVAKAGPRQEGQLHPAGLSIKTPFANGWWCKDSCLPQLGQEGCWQCANIVVSRALQYFRR